MVSTYLTLEDFGSQPFKTNPNQWKSTVQTPYEPEFSPCLPPPDGSNGSDSTVNGIEVRVDATIIGVI